MLPSLSVLKRLWRYLRPYWKLELAAFVVMSMLAALGLMLPMAIQYMIDTLIPGLTENAANGIDLKPVILFGVFLISIYLLNVFFSLGRDYLATRIGANIIKDMRLELFAHLERVSLRFFQTHQVGEIMSRLLADVNRVQQLLTNTLLALLANILFLLAILVYLLQVNWVLTLVALIPVPLTILLSNTFGRRLHDITRKMQETIAQFSARLQETFTAVRTVRAFGQEKREEERVGDVLTDLTGLYVRNAVTTSLSYNFVHFINMIGPVVVLAWGTYLVAGGSIKLGALMAFYILLTYLYQPVQDLASVNVEIQSAMASVNRIIEYLDLPPAVTQDPQPVILQQARGAIELRNVNFAYEDSDFGIENMSLSIRPRETVAIVGPSGAGKTTVINLIMRFFDPDSGAVTLDDVDLKRLDLYQLRRYMGLVDQDATLFKTTIRENIAYADPTVSLETIEKAARIANIHDFIAGLSKGYDTLVGERGVTLSGGEKQRLCLARAMLRDPAIVILDEATSALDSNSEQLIQQALQQVLAEKTAIIIAHRLATVRHADRIIVMDKGRIVDEGTHQGLLTSSPLYRELANKQLML